MQNSVDLTPTELILQEYCIKRQNTIDFFDYFAMIYEEGQKCIVSAIKECIYDQ